jgi:hypothetical protein
MFKLLTSWNKFMATLLEVPLDGNTMNTMNSCLQGIYVKQVTTENIYENTTQQWRAHQWARRLNHHLEMIHTVSGYMTRFTIWSQIRQANKLGHRQLHIFDPAEAKTKQPEFQSNQGCMAEVMH